MPLKQFLKPAVFISVGVALIGISIFLVFQSGAFSSESVEILENESKLSGTLDSGKISKITIEVAGAVAKPGVYSLPTDARVQDALIAAGNILSSGDKELVEKTINKAAKLTDGQKIYIPKKGEIKEATVLGSSNKLVSINSGTSSELEGLPGVGPATASKIISSRPFGSVEELVSRKVVGASVFEKIKELVSLY